MNRKGWSSEYCTSVRYKIFSSVTIYLNIMLGDEAASIKQI